MVITDMNDGVAPAHVGDVDQQWSERDVVVQVGEGIAVVTHELVDSTQHGAQVGDERGVVDGTVEDGMVSEAHGVLEDAEGGFELAGHKVLLGW
jgi:hypothetical protein